MTDMELKTVHNALSTMAKMLDAMSERVRAGQLSILELQRKIIDASAIESGKRARRTSDEVMRRSEVCAALGIPPRASGTFNRRIDKLLCPRGVHIGGAHCVTWWRSDIEELVSLMHSGAREAELVALVRRQNAKNGTDKAKDGSAANANADAPEMPAAEVG